MAEGAVVHGVDGADAEAGGQHPVEGRGRAAPLDVAEDRDRDSNPVRFSISSATTLPMPPRRTWPNWSTSPDVRASVPSLGVAPSATTTIEAKRPFSCLRLRLSDTSSMSKGSSGMRISAAPPAIPA